MNKKILLNASMYTGEPNGTGIYIQQTYNRLCKLLDSEGIPYTCFAYTKEGLLNQNNIHLIRIPAPKKAFNRLLSLHRIWWNIFVLPLLARGYSQVYSFSNHGSPFIKNQVITIHDLICLEFPRQNKLQFLYNKYLLPFIMQTSKEVVAISAFTKENLLNHFNLDTNKIKVIYNGGDHLQKQPGHGEQAHAELAAITNNKPFLLCAGATYPHKNASQLVQAMQRLDDTVLMIITGPANKYFRGLRQQVVEKKLSNVILLEYVSSDFLRCLYTHCLANIYISLHEGFGFPPMEAASYNKVSVLSDRGALPEIYGGTALYVNPHNVEEICEALQLFSTPGFDASPYTSKQPQLFRTYTWDKTVSEIYHLLAGEKAQ